MVLGLIINNLVAYTVFFLFLLKKYEFPKKKTYIISFICVIIINVVINMLHISILNFTGTIISHFLIALLFFRCGLRKTIIFTVSFMVISLIAEFISIAMLSYIYDLPPADAAKDPNIILIGAFSDTLFMFVFYHILSAIFIKNSKLKVS